MVEVIVDATKAYAKLNAITPRVRDELRRVIPDLMRMIAARVEVKLETELKTRRTLTINQKRHETVERILGIVSLTSPSADEELPFYLEKGTPAHLIEGNPTLAFPWDFMGGYGGSVSANTTMAFFHSVNHPGTRAYKFMEKTFDESRDEITARIKEVAKTVKL